MALELVALRALVNRHFEREAPLRAQTAQRELAAGHVADQLVGPAGAFDQPGGVLDALPAAASEGEIGESLPQRYLRVATHEDRSFRAAGGAAQDQSDVRLCLPHHPRVRHMLGLQVEHAAAALANRRL